MSDTPRTDAVERAHGLAWFGLNDEVGRYLDGMVKFREKAKELERDLAAAEAKLAAKPDVAGLVERLCMSKLFDVPELTAERKEAADALLSLSAQLAEKEAALKQLDESFEQRTQELIKAEAEFEAERNIVMRMWEASGLDPAYSIDDQFEKLRKDAERYYDLRDNDRTLEYCRYWEETLNAPDGPFQTLDAAIDAAIAARDCAVYKPLPKEVRDGILTLLTK